MLVEANSKPHDIVIYTDGSVKRDRSGWGFTVKQGGRTVHGDSGAHRITTCSLTTQVEAVTRAIQCLACHKLNEPAAKGEVWNGLLRPAHSHA